MSLVECVPNYSEGRRQDVMQAIVNAITSVPVYLLDMHSDPDHNRMVVTIAGEPEMAVEAMVRGAQVAMTLINLEGHQGVHPRMGAVDVIPFIPLHELTMADCIVLARRLGERLGSELALPVYLYEAAAVRPERADLAYVRQGGYESLKTTIQTAPERVPDYGPSVMTGAGAVAVGARPPLIALNLYLETADVNIAKQVAQTVRASNGGLPNVKAIGVLVGGKAQVSLNITDYRKTGLYPIVDAVRAQARLLGVGVSHAELVGLIPQSALIDFALNSLGLPLTAREQVLEKRIGAVANDYREIVFE